MDRSDKVCPACGALLPEEAAFCPFCMGSLSQRQTVAVPVCRCRRRKRLVLAVWPALLAALLGALLYSYVSPGVWEAYGELIYPMGGNDYRLFITFHNEAVPEGEYTVQVEEEGHYDRASKLFVCHVDSGADAGKMFAQQMESIAVRVLQPENSPSPVICHPPLFAADPANDGLRVAELEFSGRSRGPAEVEWTISMRNGDTIRLRQKLTFVPVDTLDYSFEDFPMETIGELQALVDRIEEEIPLPAVVNLHLPPVRYAGGLMISRRTINLFGSEGEGGVRTAFSGPVVIKPEEDPLGFVENIDFRGDGASAVGLSVAAQYRIRNCSFSGWETGLLLGGEDWADPMDCRFENNGVGLHFDSAGDYVNYTKFQGNVFSGNTVAVRLSRVPGRKILRFDGSRFSGNGRDIENSCAHPLDISCITFAG